MVHRCLKDTCFLVITKPAWRSFMSPQTEQSCQVWQFFELVTTLPPSPPPQTLTASYPGGGEAALSLRHRSVNVTSQVRLLASKEQRRGVTGGTEMLLKQQELMTRRGSWCRCDSQIAQINVYRTHGVISGSLLCFLNLFWLFSVHSSKVCMGGKHPFPPQAIPKQLHWQAASALARLVTLCCGNNEKQRGNTGVQLNLSKA